MDSPKLSIPCIRGGILAADGDAWEDILSDCVPCEAGIEANLRCIPVSPGRCLQCHCSFCPYVVLHLKEVKFLWALLSFD